MVGDDKALRDALEEALNAWGVNTQTGLCVG